MQKNPIIKQLKEEGKMFLHETIQHSYPFCWRTDTPLIYKPISTWFVNVEAIKEKCTPTTRQCTGSPDIYVTGGLVNGLKMLGLGHQSQQIRGDSYSCLEKRRR
ncbi:MAG: hypothetical protein CM1200mP30_04220 [Pseudomonadota bacterium]|nr:MAG: hypothetical protein CM1200mP30_04220 [Pseudomonadota bacterium]